ncbi:uncharacterized protein LOC101855047 isoform X2 [Aplysia californica]|uniref:Uncharacterized protein LOC101855047 isoform X2 n=1 Tax=Aplysia californica TaxID=6500 RepID=A0ABM0K1C2_APLCA|nr:uncharacterized protein LOC101855047 isoform X2 [Aplysia californica]
METTTKHLSSIRRTVEEVNNYCLDPYDISHAEEWQEELQNLLKRKQQLKSELLAITQEQKLVCECFENPVQWMETHQSVDKDLAKSDEVLSEVNSLLKESAVKIDRTVDSAFEALSVLRDTLRTSEQKVAALESELSDHLSGQTDSELQLSSLHKLQRGEKSASEKLCLLLEAAKAEQEVLKNRLHRLQSNLACLQQISGPQHQLESDSQRELARLTDLKTDIEQLSEVQCIVRDGRTIDVIFSPQAKRCRKMPSEMEGQVSGSVQLVATLCFKQLADDSLHLGDVKLNENVLGSEEIIERAKSSLDIPTLIMEMKSLWVSSVTLFSEISNIRERHAVDWIQEESVLRLMVKKGRSVVCTLHIPDTYPYSGSVSLENVVGDTSDIAMDQIQAPKDNTLTGWILYLEDIFSRQTVMDSGSF